MTRARKGGPVGRRLARRLSGWARLAAAVVLLGALGTWAVRGVSRSEQGIDDTRLTRDRGAAVAALGPSLASWVNDWLDGALASNPKSFWISG